MLRRTLSNQLRRVRAHLPDALGPLIDRAKDLVHDARGLAGVFSWVYAVHRGPLPHGGPDVEVHYLGRSILEGDALMAFRPHTAATGWRREVLEEGGLVTFLAARRDPTTTRGASAPVLLVDPLFDWIGMEGAYRYPVFLRGMLTLGTGFDEQLERVRSKPYRRVLKRAQKQGAGWRISNDVRELRHFHEHMYGPLARKRFGDAAKVSPLAYLEQTLKERGELLLVEENGQAVSGSLLYRSFGEDGTLFNWKYGMLTPESLDPPTQRERSAALEVAVLQHAIARGDRRVDFGLTNAVANDGIYVHKRRLGCDFTALPHGPELLLRFGAGIEPGVLERVPLFVQNGGGLRCLTGYTGARGRDGEAFTRGVLRECTFDGCAHVSLFVNEGEDDVTQDLAFPIEVTCCSPKGAAPRGQEER